MKEFIEKLIGRLKEKLLEYINKANDEMIENGHTLDFENFLGHKEAYENVLYEIVNELAEEFATDINVGNKTNADRIRSMTDEELAEFLINYKNTFGEEYEGKMSCLDWLKSEAQEEGEENG